MTRLLLPAPPLFPGGRRCSASAPPPVPFLKMAARATLRAEARVRGGRWERKWRPEGEEPGLRASLRLPSVSPVAACGRRELGGRDAGAGGAEGGGAPAGAAQRGRSLQPVRAAGAAESRAGRGGCGAAWARRGARAPIRVPEPESRASMPPRWTRAGGEPSRGRPPAPGEPPKARAPPPGGRWSGGAGSDRRGAGAPRVLQGVCWLRGEPGWGVETDTSSSGSPRSPGRCDPETAPASPVPRRHVGGPRSAPALSGGPVLAGRGSPVGGGWGWAGAAQRG